MPEQTVREYRDGTVIKYAYSTEGTKYVIQTPEGKEKSFNYRRPMHRAMIWAELWYRTESFAECDQGVIPVEVAALGKPAIAAYMYAVQDYSYPEIAEILDIASSTVSQYMSDFKQSRR